MKMANHSPEPAQSAFTETLIGMKVTPACFFVALMIGVCLPSVGYAAPAVSIGESVFWLDVRGMASVVYLTLDGSQLNSNGRPISSDRPEAYVDGLLHAKHTKGIGVYVRKGTTFGELCHALDVLRKTGAEMISVYPRELGKDEVLPKDAQQ